MTETATTEQTTQAPAPQPLASGRLTWRELFDEPEYALAQAFDDWRMDFDDLEIDE